MMFIGMNWIHRSGICYFCIYQYLHPHLHQLVPLIIIKLLST
uniref:Uncharacterized protein n=1 Tax=Tetranychus urticae TaxID=32264 RepID=T1JW15_TETUR